MPAAIVLAEPHDLIGHAIDLVTGWRGWSHAFVDPGWRSLGRDPVVIDVSRERGVELSTWSRAVGDRRTLRIELDRESSTCLLDRLGHFIGKRYSFTSMLLQPLGKPWIGTGAYCSRVIADCLPLEIRKMLPRCPAPADLLALQGFASAKAQVG